MDVGNVTEKGQVTIPKHLRKKYKIDDKVLFVDAGEGVLVRRVPKLSELKGILKDSKIDFDRIRQEERRIEAAREQRLMSIVERSRKHRQQEKK
ncbi:AbrB/MazE/SpoVT family DNA-binding domain-containing protein [Candidatus Nitrososphaera gargensis]|uniref:AbrB/MazE/SpoVT family DNA-binding domain-containing protein n=1 Tax=Candidatus Nitrososphaera gargensis TaxID=497727 RepID=UPI00164FEE9E|nr:AbrB/MazE/SpoVT family DNA-binding domain-containing protein [Candidatus Nitrososphaera gargensis]